MSHCQPRPRYGAGRHTNHRTLVDKLNNHKSPELVEWIAERCGTGENLGKKFVRGHLRNRARGTAFLTRREHRVRFVYTPKQCSWLDEIERWFSKLARSVLRPGTFISLDDLRQRVLDCVRYYSVVNAKPHRWRIDADELLAKFGIVTSELKN